MNDYVPDDSESFTVAEGSAMVLGYVRGTALSQGKEETSREAMVEELGKTKLPNRKLKVRKCFKTLN